jgi:hypothetical protein
VKKGATRPTAEDAVKSCIDTVKMFITEKEKPIYDYRGNIFEVSDIENEIERSIKELLRDHDDFNPQFKHKPSSSSGTGAPVKMGGMFNFIKNTMGKAMISKKPTKTTMKCGLLKEPIINRNVRKHDPDCMRCLEYVDSEIRCTCHNKNPMVLKPLNDETDYPEMKSIRKHGECKETLYVEFDFGNEDYSIDPQPYIEECLTRDPIMRPIGLLEAGKVRVITTPDPMETWLLKPLQKYLAKQLKKFDCFRLTSTPITEEIVTQTFMKVNENVKFISGDYDSATNNIICSYSRHAIRCIVKELKLDEQYGLLAERSLCDNWIEYFFRTEDRDPITKKRLVKEISGPQVEAQPMGKVLSFVVLCIINFAVIRKAMEIDWDQKFSMKEIPLLINGDDCVFPMKDFKIWVNMSATVGLFNSVGKTYHSKDFIEMNSLTYLRDGTKFHEVNFINWGLIRGMKRSSQFRNQSHDDIPYAFMGANHYALFKGFDFAYDDLNRLYIQYNYKHLTADNLVGVQWFLPSWLGGLGLYPGPDPSQNISEVQLKCAKMIADEYSGDLSPEKLGALETCNIHKMIQKEIDKYFDEHLTQTSSETSEDFEILFSQEDTKLILIEEYQQIYKEILETIWRNTPFLELFNGFLAVNDDEEAMQEDYLLDQDFRNHARKIVLRKLTKNGRIFLDAKFKILRNSEKLFESMKWHKLWYVKQQRNIRVARKDYSVMNKDYVDMLTHSLDCGRSDIDINQYRDSQIV